MDKRKIILVEDDPNARLLLSKSLTEAGYEVVEFEDGIEGYVDVFKIKPDLIITDVVLPKMNGTDFFKWVRGTEAGQSIPFIFLTGHTQMSDYIQTLDIDEFFEKPFETQDLLKAVERLIKLRDGKAKAEAHAEKLAVDESKEQTNKKEEKIDPGEKLKECESCKASMAITNMRCPHCGSMRLKVLEE